MAAYNYDGFEGGVISMARNCKAQTELMRRRIKAGSDPLKELDGQDRWLDAVISNDLSYYAEVRLEIEKNTEHRRPRCVTNFMP